MTEMLPRLAVEGLGMTLSLTPRFTTTILFPYLFSIHLFFLSENYSPT